MAVAVLLEEAGGADRGEDVAVEMIGDDDGDGDLRPEAGGMVRTAVVDRYALTAGHRIAGPALVEEMSSTTVVGVGHHAVVDDYGKLIITLQGNANG